MACKLFLLLLLVFFLCQTAQVSGLDYNFTVEYACDMVKNPAVLKYKCCSLVTNDNLISQISGLGADIIQFTCDAANDVLDALKCLTGGLLNLDAVDDLLNSLLSFIPVDSQLYTALQQNCLDNRSRFNDYKCPPLELLYSITETINYNCPLSTSTSNCQELSYCVSKCGNG